MAIGQRFRTRWERGSFEDAFALAFGFVSQTKKPSPVTSRDGVAIAHQEKDSKGGELPFFTVAILVHIFHRYQPWS